MSYGGGSVAVLDLEPTKSDLLTDVIAGLTSAPRTLPCKYFYDERGSELFQKICELPEYYVTRTEIAILRLHAHEMAKLIGAQSELIGLGTGAGTKTRILLEELRDPVAYVPVDISKEQLEQSTRLFQKLFPGLEILPVCADYLQPVTLPTPAKKPSRNVVYFPGSTIGNFEPEEAINFLTHLQCLRQRGRIADRGRSTKRPRNSRARVRRLAGRDCAVQSQPAYPRQS